MTKTNFKKVIETNAEGLKISQVDSKETEQKKDDGTIEKIKYKKVKFTYEHPNEGGGKTRARPMFGTPALDQSRGIKLDNFKLSAFTQFDTENEDVNLFISDKSRTQIRGWVPQENVKIVTKSGKTFAKASRGGDLYAGAAEEDEVVASFEKGDVMNVEDQNDDDTWYLVAAGGQEGFFSTMRNKIAELLVGDKRTGLSNESVDDIRRKVKDPIYWPIDTETGKMIEGKSPSAFFKCSYFQARPQEGKKESHARYYVPGLGNLDMETMKKSALKLNSAVLLLVDVYIGAGKIIPQYYITDAVVVDISEIKMPNALEQELAEQSQDEALVAKLKKQLAESKKFETPVNKPIQEEGSDDSKKEAADSMKEDNGDEEGDGGDDFNALISNEPKKKNMDFNATMKSDVKIPGLPDED